MSFWIDTDFLGDFKLQDKIMYEMVRLFLDSHDFPTSTRIPMDIVRWLIERTDYSKCDECPLSRFCVDYSDFRHVPVRDVRYCSLLGNGMAALKRRRMEGCLTYDPRLGFSQNPKRPEEHGRYNVPQWARRYAQPFTRDFDEGPVCRIGHDGHDTCIEMSEIAERARDARMAKLYEAMRASQAETAESPEGEGRRNRESKDSKDSKDKGEKSAKKREKRKDERIEEKEKREKR
jgi:hypothetical protein